MPNISQEKLQVWKKKRRKTVIAFTLVDGILGMEYSMIMPTVYLYLTTLINSEHPIFFYRLISASSYISNILVESFWEESLIERERFGSFINAGIFLFFWGISSIHFIFHHFSLWRGEFWRVRVQV